jgi:hypothetical protein
VVMRRDQCKLMACSCPVLTTTIDLACRPIAATGVQAAQAEPGDLRRAQLRL